MKMIAFMKELIHRYEEDEIPHLSAELAYYFLLSMFPFLIFLFTLLAYLPVSHEEIIVVLKEYIPNDSIKMIEENLKAMLKKNNGVLLSFGVAATIFSASNGLNALIRALNRAYGIKDTRSFFVARSMSVVLTVLMVFVIIVALFLPVFGKLISALLIDTFGLGDSFVFVWDIFRWFGSMLASFFVFSALYYIAPNRNMEWRHVIVGAFIASLGWMIVSYLFSYYVSNFGNFSATYGSLGGVIILMTWFYLTGMIVVIGGEINAIFCCRRESK